MPVCASRRVMSDDDDDGDDDGGLFCSAPEHMIAFVFLKASS